MTVAEQSLEISHKSKLLFIDDDSSVIASLRLLFERKYETFSAATVSEGLKIFKEIHPQIVILDLKLPDDSGIEALRQIKEIDSTVPVVILTGFSTRLDAEASLRLGAVDYLNKPFDSSYLTSRIAELALTTHHRGAIAVPAHSAEQLLKNLCDVQELQNGSAAFLHDVSGPLSCLMVGTELLSAKINEANEFSAEEISELTGKMAESVRYLSALIDQWRSFSDLHTLMHGKFQLKQAIDLAVGQVIQQISATDVVLQIQTQQGNLLVPGNQFAVVRVLVNLLSNAFDAVSHVYGRIHLTASNTEKGVQLIISDNGPGINPSQVDQIFKPRFTTKTNGRGLGLYISKKIVEAMGGTIEVTSPGLMLGTDFTITLPNN